MSRNTDVTDEKLAGKGPKLVGLESLRVVAVGEGKKDITPEAAPAAAAPAPAPTPAPAARRQPRNAQEGYDGNAERIAGRVGAAERGVQVLGRDLEAMQHRLSGVEAALGETPPETLELRSLRERVSKLEGGAKPSPSGVRPRHLVGAGLGLASGVGVWQGAARGINALAGTALPTGVVPSLIAAGLGLASGVGIAAITGE